MKNFLIISIITMFATCNLVAQTNETSISGSVKNKQTDRHIPDAVIMVKGTNINVHSDATGHFEISDIKEGKYILTASFVGYTSQDMEVTVKKGQTSHVHFFLERSSVNLEQVVITGTRTEHFVKDVPIRTEVLTSESITQKNAQNVFEALESVPGVRVEQQCQACNFSMVRMQGLGAEHTQVLLDGEPIYSGLAGVYGLQQIGTADIDRLEIVKGAGSALYGSSAVAGVINIISKEPSFEPSLSADLQMGNYGYKNLNLNGSMRYKNIGVSLFAQRNEMDAIDQTQDGMTRKEVKHKDGISDRVNTLLNNMGASLYFFSPFTDNDKLVLRIKSMDEIRYGGEMKDNLFLNPFSSGTENIHTNRITSDMVYTLPISFRSEFSLAAAYVHHKRNATNDTFLNSYRDSHKTTENPEGESPDVEMMRPYLATENTFTASATFSTKFSRHNLLAGVQGYFTELEETGLYCIDDDTSPYYGKAYTSVGEKHAHEFGVFLQDEWNIFHKLSAVPGIRIDWHSSNEKYTADQKVYDGAFPKTSFDENSVNPRLALKYEVTEQFILRANVGTGFRAPYGFSEDLHLCSGSPRVWKSSDLKGESSISFNLSADYYAKSFQLSINLFRTNLKNKIQFAPASEKVKLLGYTYQWENIDDAFVQGVEIGFRTNIIKNLDFEMDWTFNQGEFKHERAEWADAEDEVNKEFPNRLKYAKDSKYISRFPLFTGDISLDYTPGTWTFSVTGSLQGSMYIDYNSEDDGNNSKIKKTDPFMIFNCRVAKKLGSNFTLYAGGKNIFSYIQDEKHTDDAAFMYAPVYGATWYAGLTVRL
ncbi:MAG: TonB-dependent receptor [Bacteroidales bacterium]|nr:TonB-dependent receptor [Bacteroidales bacterium]